MCCSCSSKQVFLSEKSLVVIRIGFKDLNKFVFLHRLVGKKAIGPLFS